mmetsp:Transcript_12356/g.16982  ORF Transcript_12356/g.16982 Transcript_12356/m.16982 type:complete len:187 (-) Transcript_12356:98-658(-)
MVFRLLSSPVLRFSSPLILNSLSGYEGADLGLTSSAVGFQVQPLQATVCVGIIFAFTLIQLRINHAVGLNADLIIAKREYKRVKLDVMAGLESVEKKHFYENQIEQLEKSIDASSTVFKFNDDFKVRLRLPIQDTSVVEQKSSDRSGGNASPSITRVVAGITTVLVLFWLLMFLSVDPMTSHSNFF